MGVQERHLMLKVTCNGTTMYFHAFSLQWRCFSLHNDWLKLIPLSSNNDGFRGDGPLRPKIFSISCSFSQNLAKSYVGTPPEGWRPSKGESWIRPWVMWTDRGVHVPNTSTPLPQESANAFIIRGRNVCTTQIRGSRSWVERDKEKWIPHTYHNLLW